MNCLLHCVEQLVELMCRTLPAVPLWMRTGFGVVCRAELAAPAAWQVPVPCKSRELKGDGWFVNTAASHIP